jgi:hypothetical protein
MTAAFGKQVVGRTQFLEWFSKFIVVQPMRKLPKILECPPTSTVNTCGLNEETCPQKQKNFYL